MDLSKDLRTLRGINIAALILSIFGIIGGVIALGSFASIAAMVTGPGASSAYTSGVHSGAVTISSSPASGYEFVCAFCMVLLVVGLAFKILCVVASVFGMNLAKSPQRKKSTFILAIISAAFSLLTLSLVSCVLFCISAYYAYRMRNVPNDWFAAAANAPQAAPAGQQPYSAPNGYQPQAHPAAAPTQTAAAPTQPAPSYQPQPASAYQAPAQQPAPQPNVASANPYVQSSQPAAAPAQPADQVYEAPEDQTPSESK